MRQEGDVTEEEQNVLNANISKLKRISAQSNDVHQTQQQGLELVLQVHSQIDEYQQGQPQHRSERAQVFVLL